MDGRSVATDSVVVLVADFLDDLARLAHGRLGEVAGVAVTMATAGGPYTVGASSSVVREVDLLQYAIGRGPCLDALSGVGGQYVPDLADDPRWGEYGPRAAGLGIRSCVSLPVLHDDVVIAVAKVYSGRVDGLDEDQRRIADEFAAECAGGLGLARALSRAADELDDRTRAMDSRRGIDLAIGMIMGRAGCDADRAFTLLREISQRRNVKLREVAAELVAGVEPAPFQPRSVDRPIS